MFDFSEREKSIAHMSGKSIARECLLLFLLLSSIKIIQFDLLDSETCRILRASMCYLKTDLWLYEFS